MIFSFRTEAQTKHQPFLQEEFRTNQEIGGKLSCLSFLISPYFTPSPQVFCSVPHECSLWEWLRLGKNSWFGVEQTQIKIPVLPFKTHKPLEKLISVNLKVLLCKLSNATGYLPYHCSEEALLFPSSSKISSRGRGCGAIL